MNPVQAYAMSTPVEPDHLADITAGDHSHEHDTWEHEGGAVLMTPASNMSAYEKIVEEPKPVRPDYIAGSRTDPYGMRFPWGPVIEVHQIANYTILEYLEDLSKYDQPDIWYRHGRTLYHVYVDGKSTNVSALSLDAALAGAIAFRREGPNSHAGEYFIRMVGGGD